MGSFLVYTFFSSVVMIVAFILYKLLLSGQKQIAFNRMTLLAIYAISFLSWPLCRLDFRFDGDAGNPPVEIGTLNAEGIADGINASAGISHIPEILIGIYIAGTVAVLLLNLISIVKLFCIIRSGIKVEKEDYTLVTVPEKDIAPFSFGKYIVIGSAGIESAEELVTSHETAHIRMHHYIDLIIAQIACVILWYNPAAWLMRDELRLIHEYQADAEVLASGADARSYQMLLIKRAVGNKFSFLVNGFNHHKLKNRITMMQKEKSKGLRRLRAIALAIAPVIALAVVNIPAVASGLDRLGSSSETNALQPEQPSTESTVASADNKDKEVFVAVEEMAEFPGGMSALMNYLMNNVRYPKEAHDADHQGRAIVKFVVNEDGSISDAELVRSTSWEELDAEALRVVRAMPKWEPAKNNGKAVASYFTLPVSFKLQSAPAKTDVDKK